MVLILFTVLFTHFTVSQTVGTSVADYGKHNILTHKTLKYLTFRGKWFLFGVGAAAWEPCPRGWQTACCSCKNAYIGFLNTLLFTGRCVFAAKYASILLCEVAVFGWKRAFWPAAGIFLKCGTQPVNFLQQPRSVATAMLEKFSSYPVALLRGCWRKFTGGLGKVVLCSLTILVDYF